MKIWARVVIAGLALGLAIGGPMGTAKASDPNAKRDVSSGHKPKSKNTARDDNTNPGASSGSQKNSNDGQQYAKRGNCTDCPAERIQRKDLQRPSPRNATATRQAKHVTSKKNDDPIPLPERCRYADPTEVGSEALKIECNKAGYPTPRWPTRGDASAQPQPTPDDRSLGEKIRDAIGVGDTIRSESAKAHSQQPDCSNAEAGSAQDVNDILSGCH